MNNLIFVTFKKGKKEYHATVSSWSYNGRDLWLFVWGENGNCGYIPNARVISSCVSLSNLPHLGVDVEKIIEVW